MARTLYDGSEDRDALAEIGVSDAEYWQGLFECLDCGEHADDCQCGTTYLVTDERQQPICESTTLYEAHEQAHYHSTAYRRGTTYVFGPDRRRLGGFTAGRWWDETQRFVFGKGYQ